MSLAEKISAVVSAIGAELKAKADSADLAAVATSGSYDDLDDKPSIPAPLPAQAGNAGKVLGTDGTAPSWVTPSGGGGGTSANPVPIVANYTASAGDFVFPLALGLTVTLPGSADHGDTVQVFNLEGNAVTVSYFDLITQSARLQTLQSATSGMLTYFKDIDLGAGPMSGWGLAVQFAEAAAVVNPRFELLDETTWGSTTPEAGRTYLVFED